MNDTIKKLLSVKSIITILFVIAIIILSLVVVIGRGDNIPDQLWNIVLMIVAFYFGTVVEKAQNTKKEAEITNTEDVNTEGKG